MGRMLILAGLILVVLVITFLEIVLERGLIFGGILDEEFISDYSFIIWNFAISVVIVIIAITIIKYKKKKKKKKEKKKEEEELFLPPGEEYRTEYY